MAQHKHHKCIQTVIVVMTLNILKHEVQAIRKCSYNRLLGLNQVVCVDLGLTSVPNDFDPNVEFIRIIHNPIREVKRSVMMKYKNLKIFKLENDTSSVSVPLKIETNAFIDLTELKEILIYRFRLKDHERIILPTSIEKLVITYSFVTSNVFDFTNLENLQYFDFDGNNLTVVPKFHKYAPIWRISFYKNLIDFIPVSLIVRYCKLKDIYIDLEKGDNIFTMTAKDKCECRRWDEWVRRKKIISSFKNTRFQCPSTEPCDQELIPQQYELLYDDCVHNRRDPSHDIIEETAPPPVNPNINSTPNELEPANVTPVTTEEKKSIPKIVYFVMLLLAFVTLLTAICIYLISRKKRSSEPIYDQDEDQYPEQSEEEGDEFN